MKEIPAKGAYTIWVSDVERVDRFELTAEEIWDHNLSTMTLAEYLVYELKYYSETRRHLDAPIRIVCSGSRTIDDKVPVVSNTYRPSIELRHKSSYNTMDAPRLVNA